MAFDLYFCNTNNISQQDYNTSNSKIIQRSSKINFQSFLTNIFNLEIKFNVFSQFFEVIFLFSDYKVSVSLKKRSTLI